MWKCGNVSAFRCNFINFHQKWTWKIFYANILLHLNCVYVPWRNRRAHIDSKAQPTVSLHSKQVLSTNLWVLHIPNDLMQLLRIVDFFFSLMQFVDIVVDDKTNKETFNRTRNLCTCFLMKNSKKKSKIKRTKCASKPIDCVRSAALCFIFYSYFLFFTSFGLKRKLFYENWIELKTNMSSKGRIKSKQAALMHVLERK